MVWVQGNWNVIGLEERAEFIKNNAYVTCGLPGLVWQDGDDEDSYEAGWRCRFHASGDKCDLPTITLDDLIEIDRQ